jgi:hypothetical protein
MRRFALSTILCLVLAVALAAAGVTVDYDKAVDFSKIKTYAWKKGTPAANPLNEERVHKAIEAQLAAKGLTKTDGEADVYVYSHVKTDKQQQVSVDGFGYGGYPGWGGWGGAWTTTTVNVHNVIEGTLIVDLVSAGTSQLAWRGLATKTVFPDTKAEKIEKIINQSVAKMFQKFPPPPAKK